MNLAPFSFFNAFGANPPVVVFSARPCAATARRRTRCSTWRMVPEFVVNAAVEDLAEKMNATAKELPRGQSEAEYRGPDLATLGQGPPAARGRVAGSPRMPGAADHLDRRRAHRGQPRDRRGAPDPHRRRRARPIRPRRSPQAHARSPGWAATTTAGAPTSSRWSGRDTLIRSGDRPIRVWPPALLGADRPASRSGYRDRSPSPPKWCHPARIPHRGAVGPERRGSRVVGR